MSPRRIKKPHQPLVVSVADIKLPLAYKDGTVDELSCINVFHRVPGKLRGKFMEEIYRVLRIGGKATFVTPYWSSLRATWDFASEWPPISEMSFLVFNRGWRERPENLAHVELSCDFDFTYGYVPDPEMATRTQDAQPFWIKHYANAVLDLQVVLTKREIGQKG